MAFPVWIQGCFFLTVGLNALFIFTRNGNDSDGAVDNASGVGVLLEVAKTLREISPKNIAPVFLFTDAEEFGLLGSLMYQRVHGTDMVRKQALVINVDSVGARGKMRACAVGREGNKWLTEVLMFAREKGFYLRKIPFLKGIMMDHLPFGRVGIPALSLTSVSKEGWHLHTQRDRFSHLDERGLAEMGKFLLATVQWLETTKQK
jgi:Zn-dependent M28 family amino/carboxypeptidase